MYLAADDRTGYWNQVEGIARAARDRRVIFLGDFNCDPFTDTRPCTQVFPRLQADGFRLPEPKGEWSYHSGNGHGGSRIDHALASPTLSVKEARYVYKTGSHTLAGPANGHGPALSDHALLSIKISGPVA
jgi:endonuclease/exonuclease/phosphatase family metal-dependent hydrolase